MNTHADHPIPGEYYRCLEADEYFDVGELTIVTGIEDDEVHFVTGDTSYRSSITDFSDQFEHAPDGYAERSSEIESLMRGIHQAQPKIPKQLATVAESGVEVSERGIVKSGQKPVAVKSILASGRNAVMKFKKEITRKQDRLKALMEEQRYVIEGRVNELSAIVEKAQEAIWTINLYLGRDEEIVRLKAGKPAPKGTKITVRQLRLNMDEECAIASSDGGIDAESIEQFDSWVKNPKHLHQVLPEPKGVVAFHIRGQSKDRHVDPWTQMEYDAADFKTYFLMRNGERIYRICTELEVDDVLFPRKDHFDQFFFRDQYDYSTDSEHRVPIKPGSANYNRAMKAADKERRHFMRCLLFLQGLIDRTKVFHPMPHPEVNLMNPIHHEEYLDFVRDAEMVLSDGRPRFRDWLRETNSRLEVGHRIVGDWESYDLRPHSDENRSHPRYCRPESNHIYTIERKDGGDYVILFPRKMYHGGYAPRRASYRIHKSDRNIIDIDNFDEEAARYYLGNRIDRHNYTKMFPLLKWAIRMKHEEARAEQPFKLLLTGELAKLGCEKPEAVVDEYVRWYKFKNKVFRSLTGDDAKALRMIVAEHKRRTKMQGDVESAGALMGEAVRFFTRTYKDAIAVFYVGNGTYLILLPENDENTFVRSIRLRYSRPFGKQMSVTQVSDRRWIVIDKNIDRYECLYSTARYNEFDKEVNRDKVITDPEIEQAQEWGWREFQDKATRVTGWDHDEDSGYYSSNGKWMRKKSKHARWLPLAVYYNPKNRTFYFYAMARSIKRFPKQKCSRKPIFPDMDRYDVTWGRKKDGIKFTGVHHRICFNTPTMPWEGKEQETRYGANIRGINYIPSGWKKVWLDEDAVKTLKAEFEAVEPDVEKHKELHAVVHRAHAAVQDEVERRLIEKEHELYRKEMMPEELWEDHLADRSRNRMFESPYFRDFFGVMERLLDRGIYPGGMSVAKLLKLAKKHKLNVAKEDGLPRDFVIPESVNEEEPEEEETEEEEPEEDFDDDYDED